MILSVPSPSLCLTHVPLLCQGVSSDIAGKEFVVLEGVSDVSAQINFIRLASQVMMQLFPSWLSATLSVLVKLILSVTALLESQLAERESHLQGNTDRDSTRGFPQWCLPVKMKRDHQKFRKGVGGQRGLARRNTSKTRDLGNFSVPFFLCPLRRMGTHFWRVFWALFGGLFVANPLPPTPFRNLRDQDGNAKSWKDSWGKMKIIVEKKDWGNGKRPNSGHLCLGSA